MAVEPLDFLRAGAGEIALFAGRVVSAVLIVMVGKARLAYRRRNQVGLTVYEWRRFRCSRLYWPE